MADGAGGPDRLVADLVFDIPFDRESDGGADTSGCLECGVTEGLG